MNPPHFSSENCLSWAASLLCLSSFPALQCALMLHPSCLVGHSSPPQPRRAGENIKAALHDPHPTAAFHPMPVHHLGLLSGRFMFITVKAAKQTGWDYEELKIALQGVLRNVDLSLLWTSALLLNIAACLKGIQKKTRERERHACTMCEHHPNAEVVF